MIPSRNRPTRSGYMIGSMGTGTVSKDGSVAWSIVQVKVAGNRTMDDGTDRDLDFTCAWITLYKLQGNEWIRLAEVSNFK